jgi:PAS domain-containing protein
VQTDEETTGLSPQAGQAFALDNAPDPLVLIDPDTVVAWAGTAAARFFGWDPAGAVSRSVTDFVHPDDLDRGKGRPGAGARRRLPRGGGGAQPGAHGPAAGVMARGFSR